MTSAVREEAKAKLLVVDDRLDNLVALEETLRPLGQDLVMAHSGEEALRWLLAEEFAVILLDVQMPGMDGFDTAAQIKARERSRHIPIIFLTAISRELHQQLRGYEMGAVDYITKPFDPWVLRSKVAIFVDLHNKNRLLHEQAARLERSNAELQAFGHLVSHDLQTPLMTVKGYLQLLEETGRGRLEEEAVDFIHRALGATDSMSALIADLLAYARAGVVVGPLQFTDSAKALKRALGNLGVEIEDAGAQVTNAALPMVAADPEQLARLFQNLVGNALKYRSPDTPLEVHVEAGDAAGAWEFCVRDNGIGINGEAADRLFTMFSRGPGAAGYPGTGIGLAICKKIVEGHGGHIWAAPQPGGGTAFRFTIPAPGHSPSGSAT